MLLKYTRTYINIAYGKDDLNIIYNIIYSDSIIDLRAYDSEFIITFINDKYKYNYYYFIPYKISIFGIFRNYRNVKEYKHYRIYYFYINKDLIYTNAEFINYFFNIISFRATLSLVTPK
jgi:hypothetical protein